MVRIAGVDVPDRKRAHVALRSIYGIGPKIAEEILIKADLDPVIPPRMNELTEEQVDRIRELVDRDYISEGDLRREVNQNIRRLIEIGSYRGSRHRRNLPVAGQRTGLAFTARPPGRNQTKGEQNLVGATRFGRLVVQCRVAMRGLGVGTTYQHSSGRLRGCAQGRNRTVGPRATPAACNALPASPRVRLRMTNVRPALSIVISSNASRSALSRATSPGP